MPELIQCAGHFWDNDDLHEDDPRKCAKIISRIGDTATVYVDGQAITGTIYYVRDNGWPCVQSASGQVASGPTKL